MSAEDRVSAPSTPLADLHYGLAAIDYIRFRDDPVDDAVARAVASSTAQGPDGCQDFRDALDEDGTVTLQAFVSRRVLHAFRTSSVAAIYESMDAAALLPQRADVPWDTWVRAGLLLARSVGGDPGSIQNRFWDVASDDSAKRFDVVLDSMDRTESLHDCRIAEVHTTYGTGFLETLLIHDRLPRALYSGRRFPDRALPYAPESNLAQLAVDVADGVDAAGRATSSPIGHDQLTASLFDVTVSGSYIATTGCLSFLADSNEGTASFLVVLAELDPEEDVDELIESADEVEGQDVVLDGRRLVVLSPQPVFDTDDGDEEGDEEADRTTTDLDELVEIARRALDDPRTQ
ncbi:MAG TPA: hypothetical protein VGS61_05015 [Acidimicrobiales bacterium]|nr:hypothetical protein [Acidimicrobiales bacterium]